MAHNHESFSNSGLVAELSVSFHDELTASIQSAFGVAGELAVAEVSKLVGKAFRDMRDQLHKTLLANRNLQTRLGLTQTELRAARRRAPETRPTRDSAVNTSPIPPEPRLGSSLDVGETHEDSPSESFCGIECAQDVKPDLTGEQSSLQLQQTEDIKEDHHAMQENASRADQACVRSAVMPGASAKLEEVDQCAHPKSDAEQAFSSDSLSMAQSKLLEDWRPEPLQLQSCQSDSYASSGGSALANPSLFQGELPGMDFLASASSSQPGVCHASLSMRDASSLTIPAPNPLFPTHSSGQGHGLGEAFSVPENERSVGILGSRQSMRLDAFGMFVLHTEISGPSSSPCTCVVSRPYIGHQNN
ncbi:hypothetical protein AMELA_G00257360 [Ameiurus melas]|uniref:Uncharacterized protein n=1 Tax=Ameiurus melas TaxID=219545 RepID=A0A7J5ZRM4_AMEME|nr:hypothetical protein AMELA_G00257360 [Ameiurus melas]